MANLGYKRRENYTRNPLPICSQSIGQEDGTAFDLSGKLLISCTICKEV